MDKPLKFEAVEFVDTPTASQIADFFTSVNKFTNLICGRIMASGDATVNDPKMAAALNGAGMLLQAADQWRAGSPIAQPQLVSPGQGQRRQ